MVDNHFLRYFAEALENVSAELREKIVHKLGSLTPEEEQEWERAKAAQREQAMKKAEAA